MLVEVSQQPEETPKIHNEILSRSYIESNTEMYNASVYYGEKSRIREWCNSVATKVVPFCIGVICFSLITGDQDLVELKKKVLGGCPSPPT